MTSPTTPPEGGEQTQDSTPEDSLVVSIRTDPVKTAAEIRALRDEAKRYRLEKEKTERDAKQAEEERLKNAQEWQRLAEEYKTRLDDVQPKAERLDTMQQYLVDTANKRVQALPAQYRSLVPKVLMDDPVALLEWLDTNAAVFQLQRLPNTGAGTTGERETPIRHAPADLLNMARKMKQSPEAIAAIEADWLKNNPE